MATEALPLTAIIKLLPGYDPYAQAGDSWFDEAAAQKAIDFFPACLTHVEGALAGQPFYLEPWQQAFIGNLFGWKQVDSLGRTVRRFREALLYVPRKNGKTPLVAGLALYVFFCDPEKGQQDYIAAGEREQAGMLFRQCRGMVENEPELANRCRIYGGTASAGQSKSLVRESEGSFLRVISADASGKHGGNTHLAVVDELHVQPNRDLIDVIQTSMASQNRAQPLLALLTTADFDRESICNEKHNYACKVRDGIIVDPSFLPAIWEALPSDDWTDESTWAKANPNLGVSVSIDYLRRECKKAQETPSYQNTFKRLHLNIKTEQDVAWLNMQKWPLGDAPFSDESLVGRPCWSALDLSSKIDITAHVLVFPPVEADPLWRLLCRFWIPEENAHARERKDRVPYETWGRQGFISLTPGDVVDYKFVKASVEADARRFQIQKIGFDPWNATQIALQLGELGIACEEVQQGYRSLSEASKELEKLVMSGKIGHGGNPVLRWMASNVAAEMDPAGNIKPSKKRSTEKIDGIVATVMGMALAMGSPAGGPSIYEQPGSVRL